MISMAGKPVKHRVPKVSVPPEFEDEYKAAEKEVLLAWKHESRQFNNGKPKPGYAAARERYETAHAVLVALVDRIRAVLNPPPPKPERVAAPAEVARKRKTAADNSNVPDAYVDTTKDHRPFRPGYDAKYKSSLVRCALGEHDEFTVEDAIERLKARISKGTEISWYEQFLVPKLVKERGSDAG